MNSVPTDAMPSDDLSCSQAMTCSLTELDDVQCTYRSRHGVDRLGCISDWKTLSDNGHLPVNRIRRRTSSRHQQLNDHYNDVVTSSPLTIACSREYYIMGTESRSSPVNGVSDRDTNCDGVVEFRQQDAAEDVRSIDSVTTTSPTPLLTSSIRRQVNDVSSIGSASRGKYF